MAIGTFGSFTQARLAIYAAQTGLNVTGNNISNINTPGYTRQRVDQVSLYAAGADRYYAEGDIRVGQGALVKSLSQIRSPYLDIRYRTETAKVGYMDAHLESLNEIATILDEVAKGDVTKGEDGYGILGLEFKKLVTALQNVVDQTGHQEYDDTVRQTCKNLISKFNRYAADLEEVRQNNIDKLDQDMSKINNYLLTIRELNEEIRKCNIHGDPALELKDKRNVQLDELSELIDINVIYDEEEITPGFTVEKLVVKLDDANPDVSVTTDESLLIDGIFSSQLSFGTPAKNEFYGVDLDNPSPARDKLSQLLDEMTAAGEITAADRRKTAELYVSSPYLKQEKDADGKVVKETPVSDIRDATILTDEENPYYSVMISELTNKRGEYYVGNVNRPAQTVAGTDTTGRKIKDGNVERDETVADLFKGLSDRASITVENVPGEGDKTVTRYYRTQAVDKNGKPQFEADGKTPLYTYSSQVLERVVTRPVALDDNDLHGKLQAHREFLTEEGEFTDQDVIANFDEGAGGRRGILYYQKTLDLLANKFAQVMNDANQGFYTDEKGNYITEGKDAEGNPAGVPITITVKGKDETISSDWGKNSADVQAAILAEIKLDQATMEQEKLTGKQVLDAYMRGQTYNAGAKKFEPEDWQADANKGNLKGGIFAGGVLFSNNPGNDDPSGITAANISISNTWDKTHLLVRSFTCPPGHLEPASGQSDNFNHMKYLVDGEKFDYFPRDLDGNDNASEKSMFHGTFFEMWNNIGTVLGADQTHSETMLNTFYETALSIDTQRDAVSSVDFNDEAMNLMMYAKSYNAACRLMTTIDSVLDKLINGTGMTT